MRRKIKLFTSIISLGLSFALMTFGVFAATSHTLSVSSTISFSVGNNIFCTVNGKVFVQTDAPTYSSTGAVNTLTDSSAGMADEELSTAEWSALTSEQGKMTVDKKAIYWIFEVHNNASVGSNSFVIGVGQTGSTDESFTELELDAELSDNYSLDIKYGTQNNSAPATDMTNGYTTKVEPQTSMYVLVKVTPKSFTSSISSKPFNFTLVLKYAE